DRNRSHWSTSKTPSYTKSVSWQHHPEELLPIKHTDKNIEWYKTKQWSVFISVLTVLAVCWLTTLVFLVLLFLNQDK
ncbi:hypothetical protein ACPB1W_22690, partial [Escherichia coli]